MSFRTWKKYPRGRVDGAEDGRAEYSGDIVPNTDVVWIGRGRTPYFDGIYDEVAIWNVALSQADIVHAMNSLHAVELAGKLTITWGELKEK